MNRYKDLGTVEELSKEEDVLKFYYCKSEDSYLIGRRVGTFYYAHWNKELQGFVYDMSRYLQWGEHVVEPNTLWKEYTYPSEPEQMDFNTWIRGFMKKYIS